MPACGAKTRQGTACQQAAMANGRCRMHGGTSLSGPAAPSFKHGRYSQVLPARLAERYQAALSDPELLALREEVSLVDARLADLLGRVDSGESGEVWQLLHAAGQAYRVADRRNDGIKSAEALDTIFHLIGRGLADYAAWSDIGQVLEQRRKLVESERKRLVEMQQMMTNEQAMTLLAAVVDTVRRHVHDRSALAAISADLGRLVALPTRGGASAAD